MFRSRLLYAALALLFLAAFIYVVWNPTSEPTTPSDWWRQMRMVGLCLQAAEMALDKNDPEETARCITEAYQHCAKLQTMIEADHAAWVKIYEPRPYFMTPASNPHP